MVFKKQEDQKKFKSLSCGILKDVVKSKSVSVVVADKIKTNEGHYHKRTVEIYYMLEGSISIEVQKDSKCETKTLRTGDVLLIEPREVHKIVKADSKNKLMVICSPAWSEEDEYLR